MIRALLGLTLTALALLVAYVTARPIPGGETQHQEWRVPLGDVRRADVSVRMDIGQVRISSDSPRGALLTGAAVLPHPATLERREDVQGDRANLSYHAVQQNQRFGLFAMPRFNQQDRARLDVHLSAHVPVSLRLHRDVGDSTLDLRAARLRDLHVEHDVGDVTVTLPERGQYRATLVKDVGELRVQLPRNLAARVRVQHDVGNVRMPAAFQRAEDVYTSPGFASAKHRVELDIQSDVGDVKVEVLGE